MIAACGSAAEAIAGASNGRGPLAPPISALLPQPGRFEGRPPRLGKRRGPLLPVVESHVHAAALRAEPIVDLHLEDDAEFPRRCATDGPAGAQRAPAGAIPLGLGVASACSMRRGRWHSP